MSAKWSRSFSRVQLMDCSLPGSSLHGILQARILEWVAISFSRGSSWPRDWTRVSRIPGRRFNLWATYVNKIWQPSIQHSKTKKWFPSLWECVIQIKHPFLWKHIKQKFSCMKMKKYFSDIRHQVPVILFLWHCINLLTSGHQSAASSVEFGH